MAENERLDSRLVAEGYATGRDKAKELIRAGAVLLNGKTVAKPSLMVRDSDIVTCTVDAPRYVGRGGLKLEAALRAILPLPSPCTAMDVGASTGGFTHCMLQNGVDRVFAVDVGHGQLHPTLLADPRVVNLEGTDIRDSETLSAVISPHLSVYRYTCLPQSNVPNNFFIITSLHTQIRTLPIRRIFIDYTIFPTIFQIFLSLIPELFISQNFQLYFVFSSCKNHNI